MKRKNLVAMGLAGVMAVGMCMPVCAAAEITGGADGSPSSGTTDTAVTYDVDATYSLNIPANVTYNTDDKAATIEVGIDKEYKLGVGKSVVITAGIGTGDVISLDNAGKTLSFEVKKSNSGGADTVLTQSSNEVAKFVATNDDNTANPAAVETCKVTLKENQVVKHAGEYKGNITFSVAYQ